jgi:hypothetical protein
MDFKKKLQDLDLPSSVTHIPKADKELESRREFFNEVILPPLQEIQELVKESESAFYLSLPFGNYPISLRNFPDGVLLVWGIITDGDRITWRCKVLVTLNYRKQLLMVSPGDSEAIPMRLPADDAFQEAYHEALLNAMDAQVPPHHPLEVKPLDWQRLYDKTI